MYSTIEDTICHSLDVQCMNIVVGIMLENWFKLYQHPIMSALIWQVALNKVILVYHTIASLIGICHLKQTRCVLLQEISYVEDVFNKKEKGKRKVPWEILRDH